MRKIFLTALLLFFIASHAAVASVSSSDAQFREFMATPLPGIHSYPIVFMVNDDYALRDPDWKRHADSVIDFMNGVFARNTQKRLKIEKYLIYSWEERESILKDPAYFIANGNRGFTIMFYGYPKTPVFRGTFNHYGLKVKTRIEDNLFDVAFVAKKSLTGNSVRSLLTFIHEAGHAFGPGNPEYYTYRMKDRTGEGPSLPDFYLGGLYPDEPMIAGYGLRGREFHPIFGDLSAFIIDHNWNQKFDSDEVEKWVADKVIVRLKDIEGNPVRGAEVNVFAGRNACPKTPCNAFGFGPDTKNILLESKMTDEKGEVTIDPLTDGWIGKIIKVKKANEAGGAYLTTFDLQRARILKNSDTHFIDITLNP